MKGRDEAWTVEERKRAGEGLCEERREQGHETSREVSLVYSTNIYIYPHPIPRCGPCH